MAANTSIETLNKVFDKLLFGLAGKIVRNAINPPKMRKTTVLETLVVIIFEGLGLLYELSHTRFQMLKVYQENIVQLLLARFSR